MRLNNGPWVSIQCHTCGRAHTRAVCIDTLIREHLLAEGFAVSRSGEVVCRECLSRLRAPLPVFTMERNEIFKPIHRYEDKTGGAA